MNLYLLFVTMATLTVLSPGPGVVMTLTNALRYGLRGTVGGILGVACGALVVAAISATSLGVLLATSATAFTVMKWLGAAYLCYLGVRLWRAPAFRFIEGPAHEAHFIRRFAEGVTLQLTNPKVVFFFMAVFPQFIAPGGNYAMQFLRLVLTYSGLVVVIHLGYALMAKQARAWLTTERGGKWMNRASGGTFLFFGLALATAKR